MLPGKLEEEDNNVGAEVERDEEMVETGLETEEETKADVGGAAVVTVAMVVGATAEIGADGAEMVGVTDVEGNPVLEAPVVGTAEPRVVDTGEVTEETGLTAEANVLRV